MDKVAVQAKNSFADYIRNIQGTFAVEGMSICKSTQETLECIASGKLSYQQVLQELRMKYEKRG